MKQITARNDSDEACSVPTEPLQKGCVGNNAFPMKWSQAVWRLEYPPVKVSLMVNIFRHFRRLADTLIKSNLQPAGRKRLTVSLKGTWLLQIKHKASVSQKQSKSV